MANEIENTDSTNGDENNDSENVENADDSQELDGEALQEKLAEVSDKNKQLFERAKKAETERKQLQEQLKKLSSPEEAKEDESSSKSDEPDYARLAFLNSQEVTHPDDQKLVSDEANRLKLPLTDVLAMEHMKTKLVENRNQRASQDAMPDGKARKGSTTRSDVDYYIEHPDEVPEDLELHNKVIDQKMKSQTEGNKFSKIPFVG